MYKLGVNLGVGVSEGLGMRDSAVIDFPNPNASAVRNTYCIYSRIIIYVWLKTILYILARPSLATNLLEFVKSPHLH